MKNNELLVSILKDQVVPALGCTEPTAVAYAVAKAKELLEEEVETLDILVDRNVLKNGKEVGIPGTNEKGIVVAAALALVVGKSEYKLEVLKEVTNESLEEALKLMGKNMINLDLKKDVTGLYIEVITKGKNNTSRVIIKKTHLNVVLLEQNGQCISAQDDKEEAAKPSLRDRIREFTIADLKEFVDTIEFEKIKFINEGIVMNKRIADDDLKYNLGIGLGNMLKSEKEDLEQNAKAITSAASEARMAGHPLPVMSSAGSGNHGLVAILPIAIIGEGMNIDNEKIVRAVTLSHLVTVYIKSYTGSLSPVCGCGVAAGVGASAGLSYLLGGTLEQIGGAIKNMIAGISGMICDGAKIGCSYKLAISVNAAVDAAKMANKNVFIPSRDGILDDSVEKTIQNLGRVSNEGMANTDDIILDVMLQGCK
ncbi:L-serine ammonia-lyase, iron-sulfur-dependent, subunit alpha [Clostridium sp. OS1-26]|uniref:L-cysteine desulfidase family protein n=1 Tax=Clostridium sp. OS1-26 TaxID=3070681 RepID=UPI0027DF2AF8|nr:L-serine ammonia-lyase, iron-sulfur-dependent, subunit alpha [Clostridium sp. OS1-26]WML33877.1 L-serine ammonia-lyase, iron-sulfur-dependent, subunit alpha [Clostridium sp. OS1-26]